MSFIVVIFTELEYYSAKENYTIDYVTTYHKNKGERRGT